MNYFQNSITFPSEIMKWITLEPAIFLIICGQFLVRGSELQVDLLIWKICHIELNYTKHVCGNITNDEYEDINDEIQKKANNFLIISQWLGGVPPVIYLFFAGSLIDKFGCKPFFIFSLTGLVLKVICELINYAFIEHLPLEFFYLDNIHSFFGGPILYFLCHYTYGTLVSIEYDMNRARTMTRFDGFENIGRLVGTALSPIILTNLGKFACFGLQVGCVFLGALYIALFLPHVSPKCKDSKLQQEGTSLDCKLKKGNSVILKRTLSDILKEFVIYPLVDLVKSLCKRRPRGLHWLILLQILVYALYAFAFQEFELRYLFMSKTFHGFGPVDFAIFNVYRGVLVTIGLLIILPLLSTYFGLNDTIILALCAALDGSGLIFSAFSNKLWQFYAAHAITIIYECKYGLFRSVLSRCVEEQENGKVFSALALLFQFIPLLANPAFRKLYNATLETFPGAEIVMSACAFYITVLISLYLYTQRDRIYRGSENMKEEQIDENFIAISYN